MTSLLIKNKRDHAALRGLIPVKGSSGAANGTGVQATTTTVPGGFKTVLTFKDTPIVLADEPGVVAYGSLKVFDAPAGILAIDNATANIAVTKSSAGVNADFDGDFSFGSVAASNNATLSTTEQNIIPTTATPQAVAGATTATFAGMSAAARLGSVASPLDVYANFLVDDADHNVAGTPCNLILNGTFTMYWRNLSA